MALLIAGMVSHPACAASAKPPKDAPWCAPPGTRPIFISPAGQAFRVPAGDSYPAARWFAQADTDGDGAITRTEFVADAMRFFATLDTDRDRRLTPDEVDAYERATPETSLFAFGHGDGDDRRRSGYDVPLGAGRYAWLNVPEPVVAADQDVDRIVTAEEFATAAAAAFARLDAKGRGALRLADLPRTTQQIAIEGPCRPRLVRKDGEGGR